MKPRRMVFGMTLMAAAWLAGCGASAPQAADVALIDIQGISHGTLAQPARGRWSTLIFVGTDCPNSNQYAPEIRRICAAYEPAGAQCTLVYSAAHVQADEVRAHLAAFSLDLPALIDRDHVLAARAGATVTPQAAVFTPGGALAYSGRIDDLYAELGRPRHSATEHNLRYDNSAANPANPFSPPRRVRWGQQSTDEMGSITLEMLPVREADVPLHASAVRAHLTRAARGRMAAGPQARRPGE